MASPFWRFTINMAYLIGDLIQAWKYAKAQDYKTAESYLTQALKTLRRLEWALGEMEKQEKEG